MAVPAHRYAYESIVGPIPNGMVLDHVKQRCGNRACVNPAHLEPVTNRVNILRGSGITALNARKTHCPKGHEYTDANTIRGKDRVRKCRSCRDGRYAQWK